MVYYGSSQVSNSFQGVTSYIPLVGLLMNKFENYSNLDQFKYNIAEGSGQAVAGDPITIMNQVGATTDTEAIENFNAVCGEITAKATTIANLDGFLLQSPQDIIPAVGGEARPMAGFLTMAALLGSGAELYLPADTSLNDVNYNTRVTWDFSAKNLRKAVVGTDQALPIRLKSALVKAKQLVYSSGTGLSAWTDCTAVLVALDANCISIESSN
jgi:hypothetical protein